MPYTMDTLPDAVKKLPAKRQRQWLQIWNSAYSRCMKGKSGDDAGKACETSAFKQANGVVKMSTDEPQPVGGIAVFDLDTVVPAPLHDAGDVVYRTGLVFRAGEYPDKEFEMTPEELSAAVEAFSEPLPLDLEHVPTLLDQKLGELVSVECSEDGTELHGIVALPKWLDAVLPERKVSATWDRATKTLAGLALVRNPRVSDAALMAAFGEATFAQWDTAYINDLPDASFLFIESGGKKDGEGKTTPRSLRHFPYKDKDGTIDLPHLRNAIARIPQSNVANKDALQKKAQGLLERANNSTDDPLAESLEAWFAATRHDTPQGQAALQSIHNMAASGGAVCKASNAKMASGHESSAIQKIHDLATEHGATCSAMGKGDGPAFPFFSRGNQRKETRMGWRENVAAAFAAALGQIPEDEGTENESPPAAQATVVRQAANSAQMSDAERENERLRRELEASKAETNRIRAEAIQREAVAFADTMISQEVRKAFPAERESIIGQYTQAATDDLVLGQVTFGEGDAKRVTNRVEMLKAQFTARPAHQLTMEQLRPEIAGLLENKRETFATGDGPADDKELEKLLSMTPGGRATLAARKNGGSH